MDVGPDGSLCRVTCSFNKNANCVRIVEVPAGELSAEVDYKLVLIGEKKSDCESASEKSDEEWTLESLDAELGLTTKHEEAKDKTEEGIADKHDSNFRKKPFKEKFRSNNTRYHKSYVSPGQRNFNTYNKGNKSHKRRMTNTDSKDFINPWLEPPQILNTMENFSFGNFPPYTLDSSMNTSISSNIDLPNSNGRAGLLGNSPLDRFQLNFPTGNANHFSQNSNYWNREYSNNYQHPVQNLQIPGKSLYKEHHNQTSWQNGQKSYNRRGKNQKFNNRNGFRGRRDY